MLVLGYCLLSVLLSVRGQDDRREVKMLEDIESQDIRDNFDSFPLLRRDVKASGWCEVSSDQTLQHSTYNIRQGVDSLEEVREIGGELYSKVSLMDSTIIQPITNTRDNYTTQVVLR